MPSDARADALARAVAHVRAGGLLAYPTETVFGLGADARSEVAVSRLRAWKRRDADRPLSLLVDDPSALARLGLEVSPVALRLAARFWPGPLTLVVSAPRGRFAAGVAREDGAVGLRCSSDPTARALAVALARAQVGPLTATSLNRGGEPPARGLASAEALCRGPSGPRLIRPLADGPGESGPVSCAAPSTVVDCTGPAFALIREGAISETAIAAAVGPGTESSP